MFHSRYLFWSDNEIYRSTLAGENRTVIVNTASRGAVPKGIVLDYERRYIYWLDYWHEYIEGATYNGHGYKRHVRLSTIGFVFPVSLTILGDIFYWTDEDHHSIERVNKTSMTLLPNIFGKINNIRGIAAAEISRQPLGKHKRQQQQNNKIFIQYSDGRLQEVCIKGNCRKRAQAT